MFNIDDIEIHTARKYFESGNSYEIVPMKEVSRIIDTLADNNIIDDIKAIKLKISFLSLIADGKYATVESIKYLLSVIKDNTKDDNDTNDKIESDESGSLAQLEVVADF